MARIGSTERLDEVYDLRGLNLSDPDQVTADGESPYLANCRMYARQNGEKRVAIRTRKGSRHLSTPIGEALNVQNVAGAVGDVPVTASTWVAQPFTPSSSGALTQLTSEIKRTVSGSGHVLVQIYTNNAGLPGTLLAQGAILGGNISSVATDRAVYFIDAPSLVNGTQYWVAYKVQTGGTATYALTSTVAAGGLVTIDGGTSYTALGSTWRFKTYLSTAGEILGYTRRVSSTNQKHTIFAMGNNVYTVTDAGVATSISAAIGGGATDVQFADIDDKIIWVDGKTPAKWWDGTTVTTMNNVAGNPTHVMIFKNRAFFVPDNDPNRVNFSDLYSFESYPSVNFFYVPRPKSADHIKGLVEFQDGMTIFTQKTKHIVTGSDIGSFTRREAVGTRGAVSRKAIAVDRNYIYFMSDDKQIYRWNGMDDELLSEKVEPELQSIQDVSKVRLHLYRNQLRVYYPHSTDTTASDMLLLELSRKESNKYLQWFHDTGRPVAGSIEWSPNNDLIEFSSKVGAIYLGETDESDMGKPISFRYWTKYKPYGSGMAKDRIKRFRPFVRPTDNPYVLQVGKDIDFLNQPQMSAFPVNSGGAAWGNFQWGDGTLWGSGTQLIDDKVPMSGRGKHTQYRFECDLVDCPVNLYGYGAIVKSGRPR